MCGPQIEVADKHFGVMMRAAAIVGSEFEIQRCAIRKGIGDAQHRKRTGRLINVVGIRQRHDLRRDRLGDVPGGLRRLNAYSISPDEVPLACIFV